jgi:clan AA aspartic protease
MGLIHVAVTLRRFEGADAAYTADFLVDTGATDSMAPAAELQRIGIEPAGRKTYELADGSRQEYIFGLARIEFMGEVTAGRVLFGSDSVEPLLGVTALESVGITIDPANGTLRRLPAISLKRYRPTSGACTVLWPAASVVSGITPPGSPSRIQSISSR